MGKLSRDKRDVYYRRAKEDGYRARSAYKLLQIDAEFDLFGDIEIDDDDDDNHDNNDDDNNGGWDPDREATRRPTAIIDHFRGGRADLVVCDGAPDVTGLHPFDEYVQHQLLLSAINITTHVLRPGGTFVAKIFRGRDVGLVYAQLRLLFEDVSCAKPAASRNASPESFVVCRGFGRGSLDVDSCLDLELEGGWDEECGGAGGLRATKGGGECVVPVIVPFVACAGRRGGRGHGGGQGDGDGDFMDSDKSYAVSEARAPLAPPIRPPYEAGMAKAKEAKARRGLGKHDEEVAVSVCECVAMPEEENT
ncbi:hypothetical protein ACHAW5_010690 [Stephanodiscus triporus]|uniref:Ribosomal RNA methyltransferase FtsJ domain-containing protein n=1 Tax=Stephanodiscus triporus TaxID=2934178 RepID=A0ABD3NP43_9STRA